MKEFTKEVINLCKQVAERHRKKIKRRQYFYNTFLKRVQWSGEGGQSQALWAIPLWTLSDCLEFLRERKPQMEFELVFGDKWRLIFHWTKTFEGKTPLEACLKAVLAVLEEGRC